MIRRLVLLKPGEGTPTLWAAGYFFCLLLAYYLLRPFRDEMGIRGDLDKLPWLWTGTTIAMLIAAPLFALLVARFPRRIFIPWTYRFFGLNLLVFYTLFLLLPAKAGLGVGYAFYIWLSVFNLFAVSVFWGFMADVFTTEQAKRLFGAIGVGGTLGAICGAAVPASLVKGIHIGELMVRLPAVHLLILSVAFLEIAVFCVGRLLRLSLDPRATSATESGPLRPGRVEPGRGVFTGFVLIARSPYLLTMCVYMLLFTVTSTFLWFEQARIIKANITESNQRVSYLASIDFWVNVIALFTQVFITGRLLTRIGVTAGLLLLPLVTIAGFGWLAVAPTTAALMIVQVGRRGLHYAVDRPTREVLYTVLGPEEKYKSKSFIDTFVYRGGDVLGAWTDHLLGKLGIAVAATAIGVSVVWACAGGLLGLMQKRLAAGAARRAGRDSAPSQGAPASAGG